MIQMDEKNPDERLGDFLARVRESQGLSIEDLSERTKISVSIIHSIEASDWKAFKVEAYVRGYLNSLSRNLGLDSKAILQAYSDEVGSTFMVRDMEPLMQNIAPITEQEKKPRNKAVKKAENLPASATIFISSSSKKDSVTGPVSDNGRTKIELVGSGEMRSWVGIKRDEDDDDFVKEANIATVDNKLVYSANGTLYIVIGEPRAIGKMYLNGVETPLPTPKFGRVVRFSVYDGRVLQ